MKRWTWLVLPLVLCACGKKDGKTHDGSGSAPVAVPSTPPPPPTIKSGKGDCKTDYAPRPQLDPNPMCKVDGGTIELVDFKDKMTVKLSPYFIDQFEVTNAQVAYYLNATKAEDCSGPKTGKHPCFGLGDGTSGTDVANARFVAKDKDGKYIVAAGFERLPFNNVSRQGAMEYCAWAGKVLPTESQWEFAARHDSATNKDYLYPWGDQFDGKRARCIRDFCPVAVPKDANNQPADNRPAPVGTFDGTGEAGDGRSPWGVFDMAGNVAEVVADCGATYKPCNGGVCNDPPPQPPSGGTCEEVARGGGINGERQLQATDRGRVIGAGFRCARAAR
jgi:formylglycine-generating enzyme required for sulfatase activity